MDEMIDPHGEDDEVAEKKTAGFEDCEMDYYYRTE
jgi:hypothetical protein